MILIMMWSFLYADDSAAVAVAMQVVTTDARKAVLIITLISSLLLI